MARTSSGVPPAASMSGRGVQRVLLGFVVVLFPVEVVQQPDDTPELLVLRVELAREVAHGLFHRLAMLDVERIFVVLFQQRERPIARHSRLKFRHVGRSPSESAIDCVHATPFPATCQRRERPDSRPRRCPEADPRPALTSAAGFGFGFGFGNPPRQSTPTPATGFGFGSRLRLGFGFGFGFGRQSSLR